MRTDLFDFELPDDRIALRPAEPRDGARLLVVPEKGSPIDRIVADLPDLLGPGGCIVVNDTRVIAAHLVGRRERAGTTATAEVNLLKRLGDSDWRVLARPARKLAVGDRILFGEGSNVCALGELYATVVARGAGGEAELRFELAGDVLDEAVSRVGRMPLPPYIAHRRPADDRDARDYQTTFADHPGAVAAPTAGLHMTPELLARVAERGVTIARITLHVGGGTFLPVKAEDTDGHRMHGEWCSVGEDAVATIEATRRAGGRVLAVGTTVLRALEAAALGGTLRPFTGETDIFITPGFRFRVVDRLLTNFHLPRSTLVMLVAAFAGHARQRAAYEAAIARGYRFYSYGDASLWERASS